MMTCLNIDTSNYQGSTNDQISCVTPQNLL
jgi:hypothetical protein